MKLTFLNVLIGSAHGALYRGQVSRGNTSSALSWPVPSPAASGHSDNFGDELIDQMRRPGENMFEEVCKPLCRMERNSSTDTVEIAIDRTMWEKPSALAPAPAPALGPSAMPPMPPEAVIKQMYPDGPPPGFYFQSNFGYKVFGPGGALSAKAYHVMQTNLEKLTFIDSKGEATEIGLGPEMHKWSKNPPENLPGTMRIDFSVQQWANTCSPHGCKDGCMDYNHFIQYCRMTLNQRPPFGLPPEHSRVIGGGTTRKCVRGKQATTPGCAVSNHPKCWTLGCDEYCTVFNARSTEEVCVCDAAYLAVSKSKDEQDKDCLKPETFYQIMEGHDVFGYAAKYVSEKMRKEDQATFDVLDKNHDGFITPEEAVGSSGYSPLHVCADADEDGKVSQEEYKEKTSRGIASCTEVKQAFDTRCKSFDDNKDGQISYTEWKQHHQDLVHVYSVNSIADWDSVKLNDWWNIEINAGSQHFGPPGVGCVFTPRRGVLVDAQNQVLQLHGAMRGNFFGGSPHIFGNASLAEFERMQFPLEYRYTEPYGMCQRIPDPTGMPDIRSPECVDLDSSGIIEMSECRAMGTEERNIAMACAPCTKWIDIAGAAEDSVLTAAEAKQCPPGFPECAGGPNNDFPPFSNLPYFDFHCMDTNQDLRVTVDECKEKARQHLSLPPSMTPGPPWALSGVPTTSDALRKWSDDYFKWKAERPVPAPAPSVFLQLHQAPPSPSVAGSPAPGRPQTWEECAVHLQYQRQWPAQLAGGSPAPAPAPAPSMMPSDIMIMDKNGDGKVSRQEAYDYATAIPGGDILSTKVDNLFKDADLNLDNFITASEYDRAGLSHQGDGKHQ